MTVALSGSVVKGESFPVQNPEGNRAFFGFFEPFDSNHRRWSCERSAELELLMLNQALSETGHHVTFVQAPSTPRAQSWTWAGCSSQ